MNPTTLCISVLGLGEAGGAIAADLIAAGVVVRAYDPAVAAPAGAFACRDEADAVRGADVILSVNSAAAAAAALDSAAAGAGWRGRETVWADLNTAGPDLMEDLAGHAARHGVLFADVSLMAPVPGKGLRTPMLTSGTGAARFADLLGLVGASVEVLDAPAGAAARRKLLRSVFFKGMAAAVTEALAAARSAGLEDWMRAVIAAEFDAADAGLGVRLEVGSVVHAVRRAEEMAAATELLDGLGVPARVCRASHDWLIDLRL